MKEITKIALLTDGATGRMGRLFIKKLAEILKEKGRQVYSLDVRDDIDVADAVHEFDQISEIKPDLLIVADFACIRMQSAEEEPMYNNTGIPTIHLLFRRPWEYEVFMIWRCDFTTRVYSMLPEDVSYIRTFYPRLLNVYALDEAVWNQNAREVCYADVPEYDTLRRLYEQMPDYMKTISSFWKQAKEQNLGLSDAQAMQQCLDTIQFNCNADEYMDIMYMMRNVFPMWYLEKEECRQFKQPQINEVSLKQQAEQFLDMSFPVTLL